MPLMKALRREVYYDGKTYYAGQTFDVKEHHAKVLRALKKAEDAPVEVAPVVPMTTEDTVPLVPVRRGRYGRRDMRAAETEQPTSVPEESAEESKTDESDVAAPESESE